MATEAPLSGHVELLREIDTERVQLVGAMWMVKDCFDLQSEVIKPHMDEALGYPPRAYIAANPLNALKYAREERATHSRGIEYCLPG